MTFLSAAAAAALGHTSARAQNTPVRPTAADQPAAADQIDLANPRIVLMGDSSTDAQRIQAARRLLGEADHKSLLDAIDTGNSSRIIAVARALENAENPPPQYIAALDRQLVAKTSRDVAEAVCWALANYKNTPNALSSLYRLAGLRNAHTPARIAAIRAMGSLNDRTTARVLVEDLLRDENSAIVDAAADALATMTGKSQLGRDVRQWDQWWRGQAGLNEQEFRQARIEDQFGELRQMRQRYETLVASIETQAINMHRRLPAEPQREDFVLDCLKNEESAWRRAGARLVIQRKDNGLTISPAAIEQVRTLISDSSVDVRAVAAQAIEKINDRGSVRAILAQLQRERDIGVRAALIKALAPTQDVSGVPDLLQALNDPSMQVNVAAAEALRDLGSEITKHADLAATTANALREALARSAITPGAIRFRESVVQALYPLKNSGLMLELMALLPERPENTPSVRLNAVRALSNLNLDAQRREDIALRVADTLVRDPDAGVRLEAAQALALIGGPGQADSLDKAMDRTKEPDEQVRQEAWKTLTKLFDKFDVEALFTWAVQRVNVKGDPQRELVVYRVLEGKLRQDPKRADELNTARSRLGALYLEKDINQPDQAIPFLEDALKYYDTQSASASVTALQNQLINAYLWSKRYKQAVQFADARIKREPANQTDMGAAIQREVSRLSEAKQWENALLLLDETEQLTSLVGSYRDRFDQQRKAIRERKPSLRDLFPEWHTPSYA